ncbi:hypothetical protein [Streptomyces reniochalinae]|uniref:hypothetical protein n=1 Tax=Streptomyces reniochalinae TaxID=2250578 RepID=UPI0015F11DEB|nr:hypothetical protein [Streptomyces reniochalinae]
MAPPHPGQPRTCPHPPGRVGGEGQGRPQDMRETVRPADGTGTGSLLSPQSMGRLFGM